MGETQSSQRTIELLKEDWAAHQRRPWMSHGFYAVATHRLSRAVEGMPGLIRRPVRALALAVSSRTGVELPRGTQVGRRVRFAHRPGIVIADNAVIGDDCLIRQNVTIGSAVDYGPAPRLGDRVRVGAGAVLIGGITIGDDAVIGPNAVVTTDVPARATVLAAPARVVAATDLRQSGLDGKVRQPIEGDAVTVEEVILALVQSFERLGAVDPQTSLLSSGLIDSLDLPVLLDVIESRFDVVLPVEQVTAETIDTPEQIAALINGT